jgi:hypothetical protein
VPARSSAPHERLIPERWLAEERGLEVHQRGLGALDPGREDHLL